MLSCAIEAHFLGHADVILNRFIGRRSENAIRPVALIEDKLQKCRMAIDDYVAVLRSNGAKTKIRSDAIQNRRPFAQFEYDIVKLRPARRPELGIGNHSDSSRPWPLRPGGA